MMIGQKENCHYQKEENGYCILLFEIQIQFVVLSNAVVHLGINSSSSKYQN